jgi:translation initiation factor 3 subunit B
MHWQANGNFLCVKVDQQKKKQSFTNFQLFRVREKDIPIEQLEMKENIVAFAWEPQGNP